MIDRKREKKEKRVAHLDSLLSSCETRYEGERWVIQIEIS